MVSGNPGSGFEDLASLLVDEFDALQITVECVSDESFHEEAFDCPICMSYLDRRACRDCPQSLEANSIYRTCQLAAAQLTESAGFRVHELLPNGFGIVIIQGRHILHEEPICEMATVRFWLDEEDETCVRQMLRDKGEWNPSPNESENEYLKCIGLDMGRGTYARMGAQCYARN